MARGGRRSGPRKEIVEHFPTPRRLKIAPDDQVMPWLKDHCVRCAGETTQDPDRYIEVDEQRIGPYCRPCRKRFLGNLSKAYANRTDYRQKYGLLIGEYGRLLAFQRGSCAICHDKHVEWGTEDKALAVDHDHETGTVRGLLCSRCNTAIGLMRDDPALLASAIVYLTTTVPITLTQSETRAGRTVSDTP